jgi:hypothetical protein
MKKSIVINSMSVDNLYGIVVKTWDLNEEGKEINIKSITKINQTWEQVMEIINSL